MQTGCSLCCRRAGHYHARPVTAEDQVLHCAPSDSWVGETALGWGRGVGGIRMPAAGAVAGTCGWFCGPHLRLRERFCWL